MASSFFYSTNWAMRAEKVLRKEGLEVKLASIPSSKFHLRDVPSLQGAPGTGDGPCGS